MADFVCAACQKHFSVADTALAKYPGWQPKHCMTCKGAKPKPPAEKPRPRAQAPGLGPDTGVFTDGAASPNPGPGGWGSVYVVANKIISERHGHEAFTTNNRMELSALIAGYQLVPLGVPTTVYSDSELCVKTITQWASTWQRNGWKKKGGEIKNLDLVQTLFALAKARPEISLSWIKAHAGYRWNEYADRLATSYRA